MLVFFIWCTVFIRYKQSKFEFCKPIRKTKPNLLCKQNFAVPSACGCHCYCYFLYASYILVTFSIFLRARMNCSFIFRANPDIQFIIFHTTVGSLLVETVCLSLSPFALDCNCCSISVVQATEPCKFSYLGPCQDPCSFFYSLYVGLCSPIWEFIFVLFIEKKIQPISHNIICYTEQIF